ncbi:MAG: BCCT family transporter, partial [Cytophagales bacterium]
MFSQIRHSVFWPSLIALLLALALSVYDKWLFLKVVQGINETILYHFSWLFSTATILLVLMSFVIFISPIGKIRIGGEKAVPILNRWRWFSIVLCTTIATGILFWGMAEPIFHYVSPPESLNIEFNSEAAAIFSMSTMYLHWSFTPYAIYVL